MTPWVRKMFKLITICAVAGSLMIVGYLAAAEKWSGGADASSLLVIRGGRLIDGTGQPPLDNAVVVIADGRIRSVFAEGQGRVPSGAKVIEAGGGTLMPGLIDAHVHLVIGSAGPALSTQEYMPDRVLHDLRADLYWGVTTIRSAGDTTDTILRLRDNERSGLIIGPHLLAVGPTITCEGGHPARFLPPPIAAEATRQLKSRSEVKAVIESLAAQKVDMIKVVYDGGSQWARFPKLPIDLLKAVVEEAHRNGLRVSVHTWILSDLKDAIRAGVDGVEHGATDALDMEAVQLLRDRGVFYCPTLTVIESNARPLKEVDGVLARDDVRSTVSAVIRDGLAKHQGYAFDMKKDRDLMNYFSAALRTCEQNVLLASKNGVKIVLGTDAGEPMVFHGLAPHDELRLLVASGLSPMEAIVAGTRTAAEYLGAASEFGTIEAGKRADLLIVDGNPLDNIGATKTIWHVIKDGLVVDRARLLNSSRGE
jgi:imidazolonepropionase-like amidohydrolase